MSGIVSPSYRAGFARSAAQSRSPRLWHAMIGSFAPALGPTGSNVYDTARICSAGYTQNMELTDWVTIEKGSALQMDGANEYFEFVLRTLSTNRFSLVMWVRILSGVSNYDPMVQHPTHIGMLISGTSKLAYIWNGSEYESNGGSIAAGNLYRVAMCVSPTNVCLFNNNNEANFSGTFAAKSVGGTWRCGGNTGTSRYNNMQLLEVRAYSRTLTPRENLLDYSRGPLAPFQLRRRAVKSTTATVTKFRRSLTSRIGSRGSL